MTDHDARGGRLALAGGAAAVALSLAFAAAAGAQSPGVDLRVDADRDGVASLTSARDEAGEERFDARAGAVVLANLDDDESRCRSVDPNGRPLPDLALDDCNDAADDRVNGSRDAADLAPLRVAPVAPAIAAGGLTVTAQPAGRLRLFVRRRGALTPLGPGGKITAEEARQGVQLAAEATDIVRDRRVWDGRITVTLAAVRSRDEARLKVAPLIVHPETTEPLHFFMMPFEEGSSTPAGFGRGVDPDGGDELAPGVPLAEDAGTKRAFAALATLPVKGSRDFARDIRAGLRKAGRLSRLTVPSNRSQDQAMQDVMEAASMSMPAPGGRHHTMQVAIRSANLERGEYESPLTPVTDYPLREGARMVFEQLRGPDVAAIQQVDPARIRRGPTGVLDVDGKSSGGNWIASPATPRAPGGAIVYGGRGRELPDTTWTRMLADQGQQSLLRVDTTWLSVGHVDEFFNILPARRGSRPKLAIASPRLAYRVLDRLRGRGEGDAPLFADRKILEARPVGRKVGLRVVPAKRSVDSVYNDRRLRRANALAQRRIDSQVRRMRRVLGIPRRDVVEVPVMFQYADLGAGGGKRVTSLLPNAVNGQHAGGGVFLSARQYGPRVDGVDRFERETATRIRRASGLRTHWVEDWYFAHDWTGLGGGDVHCTTNAFRDLSRAPAWWTVRRK